jgi:hypothetical protein
MIFRGTEVARAIEFKVVVALGGVGKYSRGGSWTGIVCHGERLFDMTKSFKQYCKGRTREEVRIGNQFTRFIIKSRGHRARFTLVSPLPLRSLLI